MGRLSSDAFAYYVALGPERSYRAVAAHFGVSKRAITRHAADEDWAGRLAKIEAEARERSEKALVETLAEMRSRHMATVRAMHTRALVALKAFPLTDGMQAIKAAELAIKLERLLAGEASDRTSVSIESITRREIESLLVVEDDDEDEPDSESDCASNDAPTNEEANEEQGPAP
jgi:predicted transcriptional regulator